MAWNKELGKDTHICLLQVSTRWLQYLKRLQYAIFVLESISRKPNPKSVIIWYMWYIKKSKSSHGPSDNAVASSLKVLYASHEHSLLYPFLVRLEAAILNEATVELVLWVV